MRGTGGRLWRLGDGERLVFVLALVVSVVGVVSPGRAQEAGAAGVGRVKGAPRLVYVAPRECLSEAGFKDEVALLLGNGSADDPFDAGSESVLRVTFTKVRGGYRGSVQYTPAEGEAWAAQEETGAVCVVLARSVALTASLRIPDPPPRGTGAGEATGPSSAPRVVVVQGTEAVPESGAVPGGAPGVGDSVASKGPRVRAPPVGAGVGNGDRTSTAALWDDMDLTIAISASALMTAGFTADVGAGFQLGADVRGEMFSLGLELRGVLPGRVVASEPIDPKDVKFPNPGGATVPLSFDVSQVSALLVPCVRFAKYFAGCGVVQGGGLIVQTPVDMQLLAFVGFGPRFAVEVPLGDTFGVFGFGEALFAPDVGTYGFRDPGPNGEIAPNVLWRRSPVSGFFGAGLSVKLQ